MRPYWLEEPIDAAVLASGFAEQIPALVEQLDAADDPKPIEHEIDQLVFGELKAAMRAITSSAFAIDAFDASVKSVLPSIPMRTSGGGGGPLGRSRSPRRSDTN